MQTLPTRPKKTWQESQCERNQECQPERNIKCQLSNYYDMQSCEERKTTKQTAVMFVFKWRVQSNHAVRSVCVQQLSIRTYGPRKTWLTKKWLKKRRTNISWINVCWYRQKGWQFLQSSKILIHYAQKRQIFKYLRRGYGDIGLR